MKKILQVGKIGISLPIGVISEIDKQRQDIPRSRFLLRIIERNLVSNENKIGLRTIQGQRPTAGDVINQEWITDVE